MSSQKSSIQFSTAFNVMLRSALIIAAAEVLTMLFFNVAKIDPLGAMAALLDALLLVLLASPLLYWLVVRPYITDRERQHAVVNFLAYHDELTQLCNRRMLDEHLGRCLPALVRHNQFGALLYFDLDGFKPINDEFGHPVGDLVLVELASRLSASLRGEEIVARVGGDEFVLLVANAGRHRAAARVHAEKLALRILHLIQQPMQVNGLIFQVGCSLGVHILAPGAQSAHLALKTADAAMYQAKQSERGSVVFSDALQRYKYEIVAIGVREIDQEHRLLDQQLESLFVPECDRKAGLEKLIGMVEQHFRSELEVSKRLELNMTREHIAEHAKLLMLLRELDPVDDEATQFEHLSMIGMLLQEHVLGHDRALTVPLSEQQRSL